MWSQKDIITSYDSKWAFNIVDVAAREDTDRNDDRARLDAPGQHSYEYQTLPRVPCNERHEGGEFLWRGNPIAQPYHLFIIVEHETLLAVFCWVHSQRYYCLSSRLLLQLELTSKITGPHHAVGIKRHGQELIRSKRTHLHGSGIEAVT